MGSALTSGRGNPSRDVGLGALGHGPHQVMERWRGARYRRSRQLRHRPAHPGDEIEVVCSVNGVGTKDQPQGVHG